MRLQHSFYVLWILIVFAVCVGSPYNTATYKVDGSVHVLLQFHLTDLTGCPVP